MMTKALQTFDFSGAPQSGLSFHVPDFDARTARTHRPTGLTVDGSAQLSDLLHQLEIRPNAAAIDCYAHVDGATQRAAQNISDWIGYLPADCVRAMVLHGWHWST